MSETRIDHVKFDGKKVEIYHSVSRGDDDREQLSIISPSQPLPSFKKAMDSFSDYVLAVCELPEDWAEGMAVTGISLPVSKDNTLGLVVTVRKRTKKTNGPLILNTPYMPATTAKAEGGSPVIPKKTLKAIEDLIAESRRYLNGERAQLELMDQSTPSSKAQ